MTQRRRNKVRRLAVAAFALVPIVVFADDSEPPPADLLEFLGEFSGADGKWVDPTTLDADDAASADQGLR